MKKNFTLSLLLAATLAGMSGVTANAQVTPFEGWVEPQLSTEEAPQWYAIMSTNPAAGDGRESRFMKYDGQELVTEQHLSGLTEETVNATLLWRLEDAGNGNIYLVSCNGGLRVNVGSEVANGSNKHITMSEGGTTLHLMTSISTGVANTVEGQYILQDVRTGSYMNAMNYTDNSYKDGLYHITLWKGDEATSSGWFFYPFTYGSAESNKTVTVASADETMGSVSIEGQSGTTAQVDKGVAVTLNATAAEGYMFYRWVSADDEETVVSYRNPYIYDGQDDLSLVAQFKELDYPVMTRYYEVGLSQQNRYLSEVSTSGDRVTTMTMFTITDEAELPFTPYTTLHEVQEEGAVIDKTALPIMMDQGVEAFTLKFKTYNQNIIYEHSGRTETCEPELVWTRQAAFIDWNNDFDFDDEGEVYEGVGNGNGDNNFGDPNGSIEDGWSRTFSVPDGTQPGSYRMRVVYMAPNPYSDDWASKVFNDLHSELRNGIAYDFNIMIYPVSYGISYQVTGDAADQVAVTVSTADGEVESGALVNMDTEYTVSVDMANATDPIELTLTINDREQELTLDPETGNFTYTGTVEDATSIVVNADIINYYPLSWTVTGDGAELVDVYVFTADEDLTGETDLREGEEYQITITNIDLENNNIKVGLSVNDTPVELEHEDGDADYNYIGAITEPTVLTVEVTDLSGIEAVAGAAAYYDSAAETLYAGDAASVEIYDVNGVRLARLDGVSAVSVAALPDGVYVAKVGGKDIKFVK